MPGIAPDQAHLEVIYKGENRPCEVRLTLQDQQRASGTLNAASLATLQPALNQGWHTGLHEELGRQIFQQLLPDDVSALYQAALRASGRRGLRVTLEIDEALPALHRVPWERMLQPAGERWLPLSAAPNVFFSRSLRTGQPWPLPAPAGPLRVLVAISSPFPPGSPYYVDADKEKAGVLEVLDRFPEQIQAEVIGGAISLQQIVNAFNRGTGYDILHYVGHGVWDETAQTGALILSGEQLDGSQGEIAVEAETIVEKLLSAARLPRLIILGACESGQQSTNDAFAGVGPRMVKAGCPAVVCMQEKVENQVARQFAQDFYATLLDSGCVDLAVNRARVSLLENQYFQWAVPVLYMHLRDGILFNPQQRFRPEKPLPYKSLSPYGRDDCDLFKGRTDTITQVATRIRQNQITLVHGESGAGLTSLLEAGVCKQLTAGGEQERCRVLRVADYNDLAGEIRLQLVEDGRPISLPLRGDAPLAEVLQATAVGPFSSLVLVLDQFEEALALPAAQQKEIYAALDAAMAAAGNRLKVVLAVHSDALNGQALLQQWLGDRAGRWIEILPLEPENAVEAIYQPLVDLRSPVQINRKYVREQMVPDLAALYEGKASGEQPWVDPGQLQITCSWLYEKADETRADTVEIYEGNGGADGILARYMKEELQQLFPGAEADLARKIFIALAAPHMDHWSTPEQIRLAADGPNGHEGGATTTQVVGVLNRLARAELLTRRFEGGGYVYAFPNHTIAEQAVLLGGESVRQAYRAGDELERAWRLWLASREENRGSTASDAVLPTPQQLRLLARNSAHLDAPPVKFLMLLRAAVLRRESPIAWVQKLRGKEEDLALIQALDADAAVGEKPLISGVARNLSGSLLGTTDPAAPKRPADAYGYGDVAWAAVSSPDITSRLTAALALAALPGGISAALARLKPALEARWSGLPRALRGAELLGNLAESIPQDGGSGERETLNKEIRRQPPTGRAAVQLWRSTRRFINDRRWILWSTLGGGISAGLGLGIERLLVGLLSNASSANLGTIFFALNSYWGFLLMAFTSFSMALAGPLFLRDRERTSLGHRLLLGTLGFGLANLLVAFLNGNRITSQPFPALFGFLAGAAVSLPLAAQQTARRPAWIAGLVGTGIFAAVQGVFLAFPDLGAGISTALSAGFFDSYFNHWEWITATSDWNSLLSLVDALLSGVALIFGALAGQRIAEKWHLRWEDFLNRYSDL